MRSAGASSAPTSPGSASGSDSSGFCGNESAAGRNRAVTSAPVIDDVYITPSTACGWTAMACAQRRHTGCGPVLMAWEAPSTGSRGCYAAWPPTPGSPTHDRGRRCHRFRPQGPGNGRVGGDGHRTATRSRPNRPSLASSNGLPRPSGRTVRVRPVVIAMILASAAALPVATPTASWAAGSWAAVSDAEQEAVDGSVAAAATDGIQQSIAVVDRATGVPVAGSGGDEQYIAESIVKLFT